MSFEQQEKEQPVLEDKDVKWFIKQYDIKPENFKVIEKLSTYPQEFFLLYHNLYSPHLHTFRGAINIARELDNDIERLGIQLEDEQTHDPLTSVEQRRKKFNIEELKGKIEVAELLRDFVLKHGQNAVYSLSRLLEEKAKYKNALQKYGEFLF